jgi:hypothetical protein
MVSGSCNLSAGGSLVLGDDGLVAAGSVALGDDGRINGHANCGDRMTVGSVLSEDINVGTTDCGEIREDFIAGVRSP